MSIFSIRSVGIYTLSDRPTPRTPVHSQVHARYIFFLSKCAARATAEYDVDHAAGVAPPSGVDHHPGAKRHGGCE
jgi:hypothetical protein